MKFVPDIVFYLCQIKTPQAIHVTLLWLCMNKSNHCQLVEYMHAFYYLTVKLLGSFTRLWNCIDGCLRPSEIWCFHHTTYGIPPEHAQGIKFKQFKTSVEYTR